MDDGLQGIVEGFLVEHVMVGLGNIRARIDLLEADRIAADEPPSLDLRMIAGQIDRLETHARALQFLLRDRPAGPAASDAVSPGTRPSARPGWATGAVPAAPVTLSSPASGKVVPITVVPVEGPFRTAMPDMEARKGTEDAAPEHEACVVAMDDDAPGEQVQVTVPATGWPAAAAEAATTDDAAQAFTATYVPGEDETSCALPQTEADNPDDPLLAAIAAELRAAEAASPPQAADPYGARLETMAPRAPAEEGAASDLGATPPVTLPTVHTEPATEAGADTAQGQDALPPAAATAPAATPLLLTDPTLPGTATPAAAPDTLPVFSSRRRRVGG